MADEYAREDVAIILEKTNLQIGYMEGEVPGSPPQEDPFVVGAGQIVEPPVNPTRAMRAVKSNGHLAAVCAVVAEGCAGVRYEMVPRFRSKFVPGMENFDAARPDTWPPEAREQRRKLQVLVQAGFIGRGAESIRSGFKDQELDRIILGWGGVQVRREPTVRGGPSVPPPRGLSRFEACNARFTHPDRTATMTPVPVALEDGTIWWVEEPRFFRKLRVQLANGRYTWFKEYGDWRSMSSRTGNRSTGARRKPSMVPGQPGTYTPGQVPDGHPAAIEVMHWRTSFPGVYPYGWSAWHSEMRAADAADEHIGLVLQYLKSGLHSLVLAASTRPFDQAAAQAAIQKVDELGRGRKGLGSLVTLALVPSDSDARSPAAMFDNGTADTGKLVLHEISTKLPDALLSKDGLQESTSVRFSNAERIPGLLLGRSETYNFATASAAWAVVNRLRFGPSHEERESFLDRFLIEMGITFWRLDVVSPEWDDKEPLSGIASVAGQYGGMSANDAMMMLSDVLNTEFKPSKDWWGDVPFALVNAIINATDPSGLAKLMGVDLPEDFKNVVPQVATLAAMVEERLTALEAQVP